MFGIVAALAPYCIVLWFVYAAILVMYRFYYHPLSHIPGPPLAIATYLYEWYYDLYLHGQYTFRLKSLHGRYGGLVKLSTKTPLKYHRVYHQN